MLRTEDDIQRAHDILVAVVRGETPLVVDAQQAPLMTAALDALCWVLRHEHNGSFAASLDRVEHALEEAGGRMRKVM